MYPSPVISDNKMHCPRQKRKIQNLGSFIPKFCKLRFAGCTTLGKPFKNEDLDFLDSESLDSFARLSFPNSKTIPLLDVRSNFPKLERCQSICTDQFQKDLW